MMSMHVEDLDLLVSQNNYLLKSTHIGMQTTMC